MFGGGIVSAYTYSQLGHIFYVLNLGDRSFIYDVTTQVWHNAASSTDGTGPWRGYCSAINTGFPLIGDAGAGRLLQANPYVGTDMGVAVRRQVVLPPLYAGTKRAFCARLEIEMEVGTVHAPDSILLEWSDDGGITYTGSRTMTVGGASLNYRKRVLHYAPRQLPQSRVPAHLAAGHEYLRHRLRHRGRGALMAGIRTFSRSARTTGDATTTAPDARIDPPFKDVPLARDGFFSDPWVAYFTNLSDRVAALTPVGGPVSTATPVVTHTGTSTTDGSGGFTATWDAFPNGYGGLTIALNDPAYPGGIVAPTAVTLGSLTGTLSKTDNLYPTPSSVVQPGVTFNWVVQGY